MQRSAPEPGYFLEDDTTRVTEQMLHVDTSSLVSIKVRPVLSSGWNAYVYADEYADILKAANNFSLLNVSTPSDLYAQHHRITGGPEFLLIKRASGPEIIVVAQSAAVFMSITRAIAELVVMIVKIINEKNEGKKAGGRMDRHHTVSAVSIEIRSSVGGKQLIKPNLPDQASIDPRVLAGILLGALQDMFPGQALTKGAGGRD